MKVLKNFQYLTLKGLFENYVLLYFRRNFNKNLIYKKTVKFERNIKKYLEKILTKIWYYTDKFMEFSLKVFRKFLSSLENLKKRKNHGKNFV